MITNAAISKALGDRLETLSPALPIGWPNFDVPADTAKPYLIFTHVPVSRTDSTLKGGGTIQRGFAMITVMSDIGIPTESAMVRNKAGALVKSAGAVADSIAALFAYPLRLTVTGGTVTISQPPEVMQGYPDGPHWRTPVRVPYTAS